MGIRVHGIKMVLLATLEEDLSGASKLPERLGRQAARHPAQTDHHAKRPASESHRPFYPDGLSCLLVKRLTFAVFDGDVDGHAFHQALRHGAEWQKTCQQQLDVR